MTIYTWARRRRFARFFSVAALAVALTDVVMGWCVPP